MNANQIADELENIYWIQGDGKGKPFQQYADFIRQQQAEIEKLKSIVEDTIGQAFYEDDYRKAQAEIEALKKELALQRLSDIGQAIEEDRESAIYATGYWNGIAENKKQYELYGAVWHDKHGYQFTTTVGEKVLNDDRWIKLYRKVEK